MTITHPVSALVVAALLSCTICATAAQQPKEPKDEKREVVERPPGPVTSSSTRQKNTTSPKPTRRQPGNPEVKAFTFNHRGLGPDRASRTIVVRTGKADPKSNAQLQEDLAVMGRILEKCAAEYREDEEAAGIPLLTLDAAKAARAMYLEDYGVIFTLNVNIPLKTEPRIEEVEETSTAANEDWTEARNELFGERKPGRSERRERSHFNPERVEEFNEALLESLRNAANIRNLRDTDWVTVVVRGRGLDIEFDTEFDVVIRGGYATPDTYRPLQVTGREERVTSGSTMVLRVKKSAIDEFARKKANLEQFKQVVSTSLY